MGLSGSGFALSFKPNWLDPPGTYNIELIVTDDDSVGSGEVKSAEISF